MILITFFKSLEVKEILFKMQRLDYEQKEQLFYITCLILKR